MRLKAASSSLVGPGSLAARHLPARWRDRELRTDAYATFSLKADGSVERLKMVPASDAVDFSFDFQDLVLEPVRD